MNTIVLKIVLATAIPIAVATTTLAQNAVVRFEYDANGNRTSRTLEIRELRGNAILTTDSLLSALPSIGALPDESRFSVYPNPTEERVIVERINSAPVKVSAALYTSTGVLLEQREIIKPKEEFDLRHFSSGIYLLRLSSETGVQTNKITKK